MSENQDENHSHNNHHHHHPQPTNSRPNTIKEINEILDTQGKYTIGHSMNGHGNKIESTRKEEYKGHKIVIVTKYEIEVDGKKIFPPMHVSNNGTVGTHTLPNYASSSAIELVKTLIDCFPDEFDRSD